MQPYIELSYRLRQALITALNPIQVNGITVPIFDQIVNPSATIPRINSGECYIIINGQSNTETTNDKCQNRFDGNITFDVITKFAKGSGGAITSELIGEQILSKVNDSLIIPEFNLLRVDLNFNQNLIEQGTSESAYRKIISFRFDVFQR